MDCNTTMKTLADYFKGTMISEEILQQALNHLMGCEVCLKEYASFDDLVKRIVPNLIVASEQPLSCGKCVMVLAPYHDGNLEEWAAVIVEHHLAYCEQCLEEYDKFLQERIEEELDMPELDEAREEAIERMLSSEESKQHRKELAERIEKYMQEKMATPEWQKESKEILKRWESHKKRETCNERTD